MPSTKYLKIFIERVVGKLYGDLLAFSRKQLRLLTGFLIGQYTRYIVMEFRYDSPGNLQEQKVLAGAAVLLPSCTLSGSSFS
jgi:hypothetical protein